jgi:hypothetical protein
MPLARRPAKPHENNAAEHDYRRLFEVFGIHFGALSGDNARAEECPFCGGDVFYLNIRTGLWDCKKGGCAKQGNITTFLTWIRDEMLARTTDDEYRGLKDRRGLPLQVLKRHKVGYCDRAGCWLVPFENEQGNVVNFQRYWTSASPPPGLRNNVALPALPTALYGYAELIDSGKRGLPVYLCEGPWDCLALDYAIGSGHRGRYVIVGTPGTTFKDEWVEYFRDREVRVVFDNDKAGVKLSEKVRKLLAEGGVAKDVWTLHWPQDGGLADGYDINDLVRDHNGTMPIISWISQHSTKAVRERKTIVRGGRRKPEDDMAVDWIWPDHLHCATYASFSGQKGTFKSTIAQDVAARYSRGLPMPMCDRVEMPPGNVLYIYAEGTRANTEDGFERAGGDFSRWYCMGVLLKDGSYLNVLDHLDEIRETVRDHNIRLVVIDGQNSVIGAPFQGTDAAGRHNVTNPLHQFAQQENICLLGIRNEDKDNRALGCASMNDIARCVWRAVELDKDGGWRYLRLDFKLNERPLAAHMPIFFAVQDHKYATREILWGVEQPNQETTMAKSGIPPEVLRAWGEQNAPQPRKDTAQDSAGGGTQ